MPSYKLTYFNGRGRGECARMLFAAAGVEYEDYRIQGNWATIKPTTPLGTLPILDVDGKTVVTSPAINRYLAREFKLYGDNNEENADVDMVFEVVLDIFAEILKAGSGNDEKIKDENRKKLYEETAPKILVYLEKKLAVNNFFVGNSITLADIFFYVIMEMYTAPGRNETGLDKFPKLKALKERVAAQENIAAWIKKRPETSF